MFHVHALLKKSLGRRLQPFFVKIDTERRISEEIRNYEMYVDGFVPFHLRPNLVELRSLTTPAGGIIVGNFADHCESFVSAARRGIGASIVHSVFAETLRGWRLAQDRDQKATSLVSSLGGAIKATSLPADRLQRAKELGAVSEATDLIERIVKAGKLDHLTSLAHRDLHVSNVMVRNRDAIVIDFGSVGTGPLVGDPALLEASLLCTLDRAESEEDFASWQRLASELMDRKHFENAPPHVFSPSPREWLWETVRALRLIGLASQTTKYEYAVALAHCLLAQVRVAINPLEHDRRAFAYLLSERILDQVVPGTP